VEKTVHVTAWVQKRVRELQAKAILPLGVDKRKEALQGIQ